MYWRGIFRQWKSRVELREQREKEEKERVGIIYTPLLNWYKNGYCLHRYIR